MSGVFRHRECEKARGLTVVFEQVLRPARDSQNLASRTRIGILRKYAGKLTTKGTVTLISSRPFDRRM